MVSDCDSEVKVDHPLKAKAITEAKIKDQDKEILKCYVRGKSSRRIQQVLK